MRTHVSICALACSPAATGAQVRDMHGHLNLRDCAAAESWLADQPGTARKLKATGWTEATRIADAVILQRD